MKKGAPDAFVRAVGVARSPREETAGLHGWRAFIDHYAFEADVGAAMKWAEADREEEKRCALSQ